jgi:hypothetical protein
MKKFIAVLAVCYVAVFIAEKSGFKIGIDFNAEIPKMLVVQTNAK